MRGIVGATLVVARWGLRLSGVKRSKIVLFSVLFVGKQPTVGADNEL